jgi:flavin-dependent dehydrogenase
MINHQTNNHPYDVAIIGGGPAGCSAAITLASLGARVVLFEAKSYPHDKLCGEFLSPECDHLLTQLGFSTGLDGLNPAKIQRIRLTASHGAEWEAQPVTPGWGLSRQVFDAALAQRARSVGVQIQESTTVDGLRGDLKEGFELQARHRSQRSTVPARTVIAAHGKRASLDRVMGREFIKRPQSFMAIKAHFKGPALPGWVELHAFPGGYCGIAEIERGLQNVCLLVHQSVFKRHSSPGRDPLDSFIAWMQAENPYLQAWFSKSERIQDSWLSIAQIPFLRKRPVVNDVLMAGDAAGLVVPLVGDGIAMALEGGMLAAETTAAFLEGHLSGMGLKDHYHRAWEDRFARRLRLGRVLQALMLRPMWFQLALTLLNLTPVVGRYLITNTRGGDPFERYPIG